MGDTVEAEVIEARSRADRDGVSHVHYPQLPIRASVKARTASVAVTIAMAKAITIVTQSLGVWRRMPECFAAAVPHTGFTQTRRVEKRHGVGVDVGGIQSLDGVATV